MSHLTCFSLPASSLTAITGAITASSIVACRDSRWEPCNNTNGVNLISPIVCTFDPLNLSPYLVHDTTRSNSSRLRWLSSCSMLLLITCCSLRRWGFASRTSYAWSQWQSTANRRGRVGAGTLKTWCKQPSYCGACQKSTCIRTFFHCVQQNITIKPLDSLFETMKI